MPRELEAPPELLAIHKFMAREGTPTSIGARSEALGTNISGFIRQRTGYVSASLPLEIIVEGEKMTLALSTERGNPTIDFGRTLNDAHPLFTMRDTSMHSLRWDGRYVGDTDLDLAEGLFRFIRDNLRETAEQTLRRLGKEGADVSLNASFDLTPEQVNPHIAP